MASQLYLVLQVLTVPLSVYEAANPARLAPLYEHHLSEVESSSGPESPALAAALVDAGRFLESAGRPEVARTYFTRALQIVGRAGGDGHLVPGILQRLAQLSPPSERFALLDRAIALRRSEPKPNSDIVTLYRETAALAAARGDAPEAVARYRAAVAMAEKILPPADPILASALADLGFALEQSEEFAAAAVLYRRALAIQQKTLGPRHPEIGTTLNNLAGVTGAQGDLVGAEQLLRRGLRLLEQSLGPWHARVAVCLGNLADLLAATRRPAEARTLFTRALAIYERLGDAKAAAEIRDSLVELERP